MILKNLTDEEIQKRYVVIGTRDSADLYTCVFLNDDVIVVRDHVNEFTFMEKDIVEIHFINDKGDGLLIVEEMHDKANNEAYRQFKRERERMQPCKELQNELDRQMKNMEEAANLIDQMPLDDEMKTLVFEFIYPPQTTGELHSEMTSSSLH